MPISIHQYILCSTEKNLIYTFVFSFLQILWNGHFYFHLDRNPLWHSVKLGAHRGYLYGFIFYPYRLQHVSAELYVMVWHGQVCVQMDSPGRNMNYLLMRSKSGAKTYHPWLSPCFPGPHPCIRQAVSCFYLPGLAFKKKQKKILNLVISMQENED